MFVSHTPLKLIHFDVWGPSPVPSLNNYRYYIIFVDEYSHFVWVYPMLHKSKVYAIFLQFLALC